jgi:large subunit ribosomal protein L25
MSKTINVVKVCHRKEEGKIAVKHLRKSGKVPAVVYMKDKTVGSLSVSLDSVAAEHLVANNKIMTIVLSLELEDGKKVKALIREIQFDPVKDYVAHIDFMEVADTDVIVISVPVKIVNKELSVGVKRGGDVFVLLYNVKLKCVVSKIPHDLIVDVAGSNIGQKYWLNQLPVPEGCSIVTNALVAKVSGKRVAAEATPDAAAVTAPANTAQAAKK